MEGKIRVAPSEERAKNIKKKQRDEKDSDHNHRGDRRGFLKSEPYGRE